MQRLAEPLLGDRHQVVTGEGAKAVFVRIGPLQHDLQQLGLLPLVEDRRATAGPAIGETGDAVRVVADNPVAQRLPVHASTGGGLGPVHSRQRVGDRQDTACNARVALVLGQLAQHSRRPVPAYLELLHIGPRSRIITTTGPQAQVLGNRWTATRVGHYDQAYYRLQRSTGSAAKG